MRHHEGCDCVSCWPESEVKKPRLTDPKRLEEVGKDIGETAMRLGDFLRDLSSGEKKLDLGFSLIELLVVICRNR